MDHELPDLSVLRRCWTGYEDVRTTHEVTVHDTTIGGRKPVIIAGPCAVESLDHTLGVARAVQAAGGTLLRGGAYKPRTNPHSFQGLGLEGLKILAEVRRQTGLGIVTEVIDPRLVEQVAEYADMLQVGSRSAQNFPLLDEVGRASRPVLLKRGWSSTLEEWLCAAEYIARGGNRDIVLCERGIRTSCHWSYARNILDLNVLEPVRRASPLPVIVDPSHACGEWTRVASLSRASLAAGAHGLLVETVGHYQDRSKLRCDAQQGIPPETLAEILGYAESMEISPLNDLTPAPAIF